MLLNVVTLAGDVRRDLHAAGELHTRNLPLAGVGLLRSHDSHTQAHALHGGRVGGGERG